MVALLFRSLISEPAEIVSSSASALHNALVLCVPSKDSVVEGSSSKGHRLPKELIQSCIRPILLHLREYTKLTIPLLRGLSRLLSLLSSWFNKTLGEKLLEHLHRVSDVSSVYYFSFSYMYGVISILSHNYIPYIHKFTEPGSYPFVS